MNKLHLLAATLGLLAAGALTSCTVTEPVHSTTTTTTQRQTTVPATNSPTETVGSGAYGY